MLPQFWLDYKTVQRRFKQWLRNMVLRIGTTDPTNTLRVEGVLDELECFH